MVQYQFTTRPFYQVQPLYRTIQEFQLTLPQLTIQLYKMDTTPTTTL